MIFPRALWISFFVLLIIAVLTVTYAQAAGNIVSSSRLTNQSSARTIAQLTPTECVGLGLTAVVVGANGSNQSELILGTAGVDSLSGNGGVDCIVGGDGADSLFGGNGKDILIGGPGDDYIDGGGGKGDVCYGGAGNDTFFRCETTVQ